MNDNEHSLTPDFAAQFAALTPPELAAALSTAAGLYAFYKGAPSTRELLYTIARALTPQTSPFREINMTAVLEPIAAEHGTTIEQIRGRTRTHSLSHVRQHCMYELRRAGLWSYPEIGRFLGNRDHTTCIYGVRKHAERLAKTELRAATLARLKVRGALGEHRKEQ